MSRSRKKNAIYTDTSKFGKTSFNRGFRRNNKDTVYKNNTGYIIRDQRCIFIEGVDDQEYIKKIRRK